MSAWRPPKDLDKECLEICIAMNKLPGIRTTSSCCGHGKEKFCIFFMPKNLEALPAFLYWTDVCHIGVAGWHVYTYTDCSMAPARFVLEGPIGDFEGAKKIAMAIEKYIDQEGVRA